MYSYRLHDNIPNAKIPNVPKYPRHLYAIHSLSSFRLTLEFALLIKIFSHKSADNLILYSVVTVSYQDPRTAESWQGTANNAIGK